MFKRNSYGEREKGQAMVEFALMLPILVTVMFAVIEMGDAYWKYQQLSAAASEGARKAIVSRSLSDADREAAIETAVQNAAPSLDAADLTITINSTWDAGDDVTVSATYPIVIDIFKIPVWSGNLSSERTMRVEQ